MKIPFIKSKKQEVSQVADMAGKLEDMQKTVAEIKDVHNDIYNQTGYARNQGGFINPISGTGTNIDKNSLSFFFPNRLFQRDTNETLYVESWAARKFIDIPVDDMFFKWREFENMEEETIERVVEVENQFNIKSKLAKTMKGGRLMGTGLMIFLTAEAPPNKPLNLKRFLPGDLLNILVVDRFDATVKARETNPFNPNYGKPVLYTVNAVRGGSTFTVHHSRVIRFDGMSPLSDNSWTVYDQDWGVPSINPVITEIFQDSNVAKGIANLVNEASIPIQKVDGFEEALSGSGGDGDISLEQRMAQTTYLRSIYRTVFMDKEDEFSREEVTFSGLPDLMDRNATRLAAAADIPETRFWSKSIAGFQSTGTGEERSYALKIGSDQKNQLTEPLHKIDNILERHLGLTENIQYEFPSILDLSEADKVDAALKKAQIVVPLVTAGIIDEDEARTIMDGDEIIGNLENMDLGIEGVDEFRKALANAQIQSTMTGEPGNAE